MLAEASFLLTVTMKQQTRVISVRIGDLQRNLKLTCKNLQSTDKLRVRALYGSFGSELCVNGIDKMSGFVAETVYFSALQ